MGGEDFGMFGRVEPIIPTALFWLGAVNNEVYEKAKRDDLTLPSLHSDLFLPDADPAGSASGRNKSECNEGKVRSSLFAFS